MLSTKTVNKGMMKKMSRKINAGNKSEYLFISLSDQVVPFVDPFVVVLHNEVSVIEN